MIVGNVLDYTTKKPVEFATIAILKTDSSLVNGSVSSPEGKFAVIGLVPGNYIVQVTFIGYERKYISVVLADDTDKPVLKMGTIVIKEASVNLQTVTVMAEKPLIENKIDRKVFNVSQSIAATSSNVSDILKQVPSVSVDAEGTVSLRGNENVVFLINGKPSSISGDNQANILQQMPANMIENIEVITKPSAKYDPDGVTGIININLKKDAKLGLNGSVGMNTSYNNKYNGQINLGYNSGKFNINGSYSGRHEETYSSGSKKTSSPDTAIFQNDSSKDQRQSHMGRIGADYSINDKNAIGLVSSLMYRERNDLDWSFIHPDYATNPDGLYNNVAEHSYGLNTDNNLYYIKKFAKPQQELKFNFLYNNSQNNRPVNFSQHEIINHGNEKRQKDHTLSGQSSQAFQADYTHPFSSKIVLETGFKSNFNQLNNNYTYDSLLNGTWTRTDFKTDIFDFKEQNHAAYITFRMDTGKFGYQAGLRGEYYSRHFSGKTTANKNIPQLYPTLHLQYKLTNSQDLQLSYSRRVNRPGPQQLNPTTRYMSPTSRMVGNPDLDAEYVNSIEFGHLLKGVKNSLTSNVFYRYIQNGMTRTMKIENSITTSTYDNLNSSSAYGMEMTGIYYVTKWWFLNANASVFHNTLNGKVPGKDTVITTKSTNTNFKLISNMTIPNVVSFQFSGFYRSGMRTLQSQMKPFYSFDAALRKDVLKGKGSVTLTVSDIFNTMTFHIITHNGNTSQDMERKRESRIIYLGFVYRFGQPVKKKQDRSQQQDNGVDNNMDQMF